MFLQRAILVTAAISLSLTTDTLRAEFEAAGSASAAKAYANSQLQQTAIVSGAAVGLGAISAQVALGQINAAVNINSTNQDAVTERLNMQLSALRDARDAQFAIDQKRFEYEKELNTIRIDLAKQQAEANYRLAQMTLNAQLVQAGLSSGFQNKNSGSSLEVSNTYFAARGPQSGSSSLDFAPSSSTSDESGNNSPLPGATVASQLSSLATGSSSSPSTSTISANLAARGARLGLDAPKAGLPVAQSDLMSFQSTVETSSDASQGQTSYADSSLNFPSSTHGR